jgi:glycosyltransferase involved in cell wall biosynthesis
VALYVGDLTKAHAYLKELSAATADVRFVVVTPSQVYHWSSNNVQILPPTSELHRYYAAADAFVFPTTYDSFGMVVLEAMAAGLPVFTSDQAGAAELIEPGKDGFVLPLADWVGRTASALGDRAQMAKIGEAAAQSAKRFDWPAVVSAVEKVYAQVISGTF